MSERNPKLLLDDILLSAGKIERFPEDFMFELTRQEYHSLRTQFATLENGRGKYSKFNPFAFTEQGVAMLASVLNKPQAIGVNIQIVRAFV